MNHFIEKNNSIKGAASPKTIAINAYVNEMNQYFDSLPPVEAPVLKPPALGSNSFLKSFTVLEIVDCLCDGPIGGLVYQDINGIKIADSTDYLYSVYLDNKQVATK